MRPHEFRTIRETDAMADYPGYWLRLEGFVESGATVDADEIVERFPSAGVVAVLPYVTNPKAHMSDLL